MSEIADFHSDRAVFQWHACQFQLICGQVPLYMGILNVTPDSFSDGGSYVDVASAVEQARQLIAQGADILDIGGESTRPGAEPVSQIEELRRVLPVVEAVSAEFQVPISIDTTKSAVAEAALQKGAAIVNDISGLTFDERMPRVCAQSQAGVIAMHIQGTPQTMQIRPEYHDVVEEIRKWLEIRSQELQRQGIHSNAIVLDPGLGFGKTAQHNLDILANIPRFRSLGYPILIGHSRKRFLGKLLGRPVDERTLATVGVSLAAASLGADILRLHEITPSRDCWQAWNAVMSARPRGNDTP